MILVNSPWLKEEDAVGPMSSRISDLLSVTSLKVKRPLLTRFQSVPQADTDLCHLVRRDGQPGLSLDVLGTVIRYSQLPPTPPPLTERPTDLFGKIDVPLVTPIDNLDVYPIELSACGTRSSR
jgi:hypothetical protein